ncbi:MAG: DUF3611 family protein [Cyanobacteria bacterium SID2]|nr:DUF3611 family protein [Cyanobacteria bacterium SID2]MBP0004606.1 DUF3611 family protein [Cyanobacteria bacterium SBC]
MQIAAAFRRAGWVGLWLQSIFAIIPVLILLFVLLFRGHLGQGNPIGAILSYACLLVLLFTIYWSFRYTQVAKQLEDPERRPHKSAVFRCVWIGIAANTIGAVCALLVNLGQVGQMLFTVLSLPPGASTMTTPLQGSAVFNRGPAITALQIVGLQASAIIIAAELAGIAVALWLLYYLTPRSRTDTVSRS